jgi:hypothetical protein
MFQFSGFAFLAEYIIFNYVGCPIRKSSDLTPACGSPKLIAAYHVLLRLWEPRHPPYALNYFSVTRTQLLSYIVRYVCFMLLLIVYCSNLCRIPLSYSYNNDYASYFTSFVPSCQRTLYNTFRAISVENNGFEPLTLCVQGRCSSQLS